MKNYPRAEIKLLNDLPEELKNTAQWDCWKFVGEGQKVPINPKTGRVYKRGISSEEMSTCTFAEALEFFNEHENITGLGFRFKNEDDFCGVDLDDVRNEKTGELASWAEDLIKRFNSYAEVSPSGTGVHIICKAYLERAVTKTIVNGTAVEMYFNGRYFTITGKRLEQCPNSVKNAQTQVDYLYEFIDQLKKPAKEDFDDPTTQRAMGIAIPPGMDFEEMLKEKHWRFEKQILKDGAISYNYHGILGQHCLIQGSVHEAQKRNPKQSRFVVRNGYVCHQCFDSDCQSATEPKTRKALLALGLNKLLEASMDVANIFRKDIANAALFAQMHAGNVIFVADQGIWYAWDGKRYLANNNGEVMRRARATVRYMYEEAFNEQDTERRKARFSWAIQSESRLEKMVTYSRSEQALEARNFSDTFDSDPLLFNCDNGVINLSTGELQKHNQKFKLTRISPIPFDIKAKCDEFNSWLLLTCNGSKELMEYIIRFMGYCMSGLTQEQCFWLFYGPTKTGKSTFIRVLRGLMGDYSSTLPEGAVIQNNIGNPEHAMAELAGTRLATLVELRAGTRYDDGKLKQITGQDRIGASKKYMNYFEFQSRAKLAMAVNDKPSVKDTEDAFWSRVKPIPFMVFVPPEKRIPDLDKFFLEKEGSGILAQSVRGFQQWRKCGMMECREVQMAAAEYRHEQDIISQFIEETCNISEELEETSSNLYHSLLSWLKENNYRMHMSKIRLGKELHRLGFKSGISTLNGLPARIWKGLRVASGTGTITHPKREIDF